MSAPTIRPFVAADAPALAALYHAAVHQVGARDYSAEQVAVWSPAPRAAADYCAQAEGRTFLVAVDDAGDPVGYADLRPDGYLDHLYRRPDANGTGVGSALVAAIEAAARAAGLSQIFVDASEAARRLLLRRGFAVEHRRDLVLDGVAIHNYRMTKRIG